MDKVTDGTQPLAVSTAAGKGLKQGAASGAIVLAAIGLLRGLGVQLWDEDQDMIMAGAITVLVGALGTLWGGIRNLLNNRNLAKNGVTMTRQQ